MWYGARGTNAVFQIGYATSPLITLDANPPHRIPSEFTLNHNYPNPFNPTTTIAFDVPRFARVALKVFNALGEEVATLVDEERQPGNYSVVWDASSAASGTYLVRLMADGHAITQKMMLVK
jgi:hypothetical protein